jgi:cytochrome b561|tara:strand:- start:1275 stop:1601 length:327 start_codon:yes stop_codon:yes gene_type:complete
MNYNKLRPYTAVTMMLALALLTVTGGILYFAPQGPDSRIWSWLGLSKHQFKDIHFYLGFIVAIFATIHGLLNLSAINHYLKHSLKVWTHPLLFAFGIVFIAVITALQL